MNSKANKRQVEIIFIYYILSVSVCLPLWKRELPSLAIPRAEFQAQLQTARPGDSGHRGRTNHQPARFFVKPIISFIINMIIEMVPTTGLEGLHK
jgi:hypothetical protein